MSEDNLGAASLAKELQQAAPSRLRLVHSSEAGAEQLQECTHFLLLLNKNTFVTDTDPDRPGERLAKQLREAFRINSHLGAWNYRSAITPLYLPCISPVLARPSYTPFLHARLTRPQVLGRHRRASPEARRGQGGGADGRRPHAYLV